MLSSRDTTAAATRPPRVMQTMASNGPASFSRQASARESRWNWSHDTGKNFSGTACSGPLMATPSQQIEHEIEARHERALGFGDAHQKLAAKQAIAAVVRLAGKVELRRQQPTAGRLDLDMDVARAPRVGPGHHRAQAIATLGIGELVAAQAKTLIVVLALAVRLPEIDQGPCDRPAIACEHKARNLDRLPAHTGLPQVAAF